MSELNVELYGQHIGVLDGTRDRFDFNADLGAVNLHGDGSTVLSFAVPLTMTPRPEALLSRRNFFEEILAEGTSRQSLAGNARLDGDNTMALLRRYGRDVAGAIQIWDSSDPNEPRTPSSVPVSPARVRELLANVKRAPLGNTTLQRMSSLAGVQDKIVLAQIDGQWAEPLDGFASTHIIKPVAPKYPTVIFDEEYGSRLARHLGLADFDTRIETFDGVSALVIERYDRKADGRIHQEDFNQALGFRGDQKYQEHGHSGLASIASVLTENINRRATERLLQMTALSVAVGNLDMHAKNISVLHLADGTVRLAPMYDVVPQIHQPLSKDFAFTVNGVFAHSDITRDDLVAEGASWGIRGAVGIVDETIAQVAEFVAGERPVAGAHHSLTDDITRFCQNLTDGRGASSARKSGASTKRPHGTRRKDRGLGLTPNGGTSGSYAERHHSEADIVLRPAHTPEGGWGGPVEP